MCRPGKSEESRLGVLVFCKPFTSPEKCVEKGVWLVYNEATTLKTGDLLGVLSPEHPAVVMLPKGAHFSETI